PRDQGHETAPSGWRRYTAARSALPSESAASPTVFITSADGARRLRALLTEATWFWIWRRFLIASTVEMSVADDAATPIGLAASSSEARDASRSSGRASAAGSMNT